MPSKKSVGKSISDYYKKGHISDQIKEIAVDEDRYDAALDDPSTYERIDRVYEKYGIKQYNDIDEFSEAMEEFAPNMKRSEIKQLWKDYEHREKLIVSGQYEEYRLGLMKENYLAAARRSHLPDKIIKNLENLEPSKWDALVYYPSQTKESTYDYLLPRIGEFVYEMLNVEYGTQDDPRIELEDRIKQAFKTAGLEWVDYESYENTRGRRYLERRGIDVDEILNEYAEENEEPLDERDELDIIAFTMAEELSSKGRQIRQGKKSSYLPGIGSSREGTKNRDLFLAIQKYMK